MTVCPLSREVATNDLVDARNKVRGALRTPGWSTADTQEGWYESINKPGGGLWYWEFWEGLDVRGVGGLDLDRANRSAELSVLAFEPGKGYGKHIVQWLLHEAFENQNMHKVWAEVYDCNPDAEKWPHLLGGYRVDTTKRPDQKFWGGIYWASTFYDIFPAG